MLDFVEYFERTLCNSINNGNRKHVIHILWVTLNVIRYLLLVYNLLLYQIHLCLLYWVIFSCIIVYDRANDVFDQHQRYIGDLK